MNFRKLSYATLAVLVLGAGAVSAHFYTLTDPVDTYAAETLNKALVMSFRDDVEYCGLIGYDADGKLVSTKHSAVTVMAVILKMI